MVARRRLDRRVVMVGMDLDQGRDRRLDRLDRPVGFLAVGMGLEEDSSSRLDGATVLGTNGRPGADAGCVVVGGTGGLSLTT